MHLSVEKRHALRDERSNKEQNPVENHLLVPETISRTFGRLSGLLYTYFETISAAPPQASFVDGHILDARWRVLRLLSSFL